MLSDFAGRPLEQPVKATDNEEVARKRALLRRSKRSERDLAKWQQEHDGPDPRYRGLVTSTGRIGHVTNIRADTLSRSYLGENKNEVVPVKWLRYWALICEKATEWGKEPLLRFEPSNRGAVDRKLPDMHMITPERHAELLRKERWYDEHAGD